ncbi:MAG: hypothetical protein R3C56_36120 [Pirellulaceae bacterium]
MAWSQSRVLRPRPLSQKPKVGPTAYATPWPLSEDLFLVAYSANPHTSQGKQRAANDFAIYLVDTLGGRELIYRDGSMSCFCPIPVQPRPTPPTLPSLPSLAGSKLATADASGVFYVQNVYESDAQIEPGSVKMAASCALICKQLKPFHHVRRGAVRDGQKILGTVPVAEDGSVAFRVPSGESLLFQLLDEKRRRLSSGMRSFTYVHAGKPSVA